MRRKRTRGISLGTVVMMTITALVLVGFFAMLPKLAGETDLRLNATDIFVALDQTITGFGEYNANQAQNRETETPPAAAAFTPAPTPAPTPIPKMRFTFCAAGQIAFTNEVRKAVTAEDGYHFDWIFAPIADVLNADLTIATLANSTVSTDKLTDYNMPVEMLPALKGANIDALSLGHYYTLDGGLSAMSATRSGIASAGMLPYGAYSSQQEADGIVITEVNGVSIALLSYVEELSKTGKKQVSNAESAFAVAPLSLERVQQDIAAAKAGGAQVIIVSVSWGKNSDTTPSTKQKDMAQSIANAGADIIIGTHPEAVETIQILTADRGDGRYHPVLCAYSMGNLFSADREKRVNLSGLLLHADVEYDPVTDTVAFDNLHYTPTYCWRGKVDGKYRYQVFVSNLESYPEYVDKDQLGVMSRCLKVITDAMEGSIFDQ